MDADPHKPLRDDVRLLGELLGETLTDPRRRRLFRTVERVRALAKSARAGHDEEFRLLADELAAVPLEDARSRSLAPSPLSEPRQHRRAASPYPPAPRLPARSRRATAAGSCDDAFARLIDAGVSPIGCTTRSSLAVELVFTAHPTEVARRTVVQKYNRIARALADRDRTDLTVPEQEARVASLRREIADSWGTREIREERPTPLDEVRSGLIVFEQSLWDAVPRTCARWIARSRQHTGRRLPLDATPIRFGSWIGGDRDGNPNVTPEVTRQRLPLARWMAAHLYLREIDALRDELSIGAATPELRAAWPAARVSPTGRCSVIVRRGCVATRDWIDAALQADTTPDPPAGGLRRHRRHAATRCACAHTSLETTGKGLIAAGRLADVLRRLATFGVTLARLDVRQEAARHTRGARRH